MDIASTTSRPVNISIQADQITAATFLQKYIRFFNATQITEPKGEVPALRGEPNQLYPIGPIIAYAIRPETKSQTPWVKLPPQVPVVIHDGAYKKLTHENANYVGLTTKDPDHFELRNSRLKIDVETQDFMKRVNTEILVPLKKINETQWLAKNLGLNLDAKIVKKLYQFDVGHWVPLAKILASMHAKRIVHRDIKTLNLYFIEGYVRLSDLDLMGKIGTFTIDAGTRAHSPTSFWRSTKPEMDNNHISDKRNAVKKDQYNFFASMIEAHCGIDPISNQGGEDKVFDSLQFSSYKPYSWKEIDSFCWALPCSDDLKKELIYFLLNPLSNKLTYPLHAYLLQPNKRIQRVMPAPVTTNLIWRPINKK